MTGGLISALSSRPGPAPPPGRAGPSPRAGALQRCRKNKGFSWLIVSDTFAARHKPDYGFAAEVAGQATPLVAQTDRTSDGCADASAYACFSAIRDVLEVPRYVRFSALLRL